MLNFPGCVKSFSLYDVSVLRSAGARCVSVGLMGNKRMRGESAESAALLHRFILFRHRELVLRPSRCLAAPLSAEVLS